jgi:nucleotide-binding universal stress UspA family protein
MKDSPSRFVVLAAIDDSALADATSAAAAKYANATPNAELHFVHVVAWIPTQSGPVERANGIDPSGLLESARINLDRHAKSCKFEGDVVCHIALGDPSREILQMAARIDADVVFTGSHGRRGFQRLLMGSVAERVVRGASCPVVVVREKDYHRTLAPEIEPACSDCLKAQSASRGKKLWCTRHSEKHPTGP